MPAQSWERPVRCLSVSVLCSYQGPFSQNTGTLLLKPTDAAKRFVASWLGFQRKHLIDWGPNDFDKLDGNQRRSDQVLLAWVRVPSMPIFSTLAILSSHAIAPRSPQKSSVQSFISASSFSRRMQMLVRLHAPPEVSV